MSETTIDYYDPPNRMAGEGGFKDKTILITGGSGFLGKVFIEKVLRTCPEVTKIYVIIRTKREKSPQARLKDIFDGPLYNLLKQTRGEDILNKVVAVSGDIQEPNLGISPDDRKLLTEEVQVIYHLAATTRFDEPFKRAVLFNARGTKLMLQLAKECTRLLMFLHCSTAYCFPHEKVLYEKTYDSPADPEMIIGVCETMDDEIIEVTSKILMRNCPNTYTYSKALAEGIVSKEIDNLPIMIMRPSVVIPVWQDPLPGWTDNFYGPMGLLIAAGKGILRTMYCNPEGVADFVPVDVVANAFICGFWLFMQNKETRIYNLTTTAEFKATWSDIIEMGKQTAMKRMPFNWVVWYPGGSMKTSKLLHQICAVLFHYIPAAFLDTIIILTGNKPVLWKVQQKIAGGSELFEFYTNRKWECRSDKGMKARELLNQTERKIYKLDKTGLDLDDYFYNAAHGARLYLLKEGDESLPTAKRHMKIMWAVDKIVKTIFLLGFFYLLFKYFVNPLL